MENIRQYRKDIGQLVLLLSVVWMSILWSSSCSRPQSSLDTMYSYSDGTLATHPKQRGGHVFGRIDSSNVENLVDQKLDWVTLVSWASQKHERSDRLHYVNTDTTMAYAERRDWIERINLIRSHGMKVFLKPHVWIDAPSEGKWRSDICPISPESWQRWSQDYREYILRFAGIAAEAEVDMFCLGTEMTKITQAYPEFWQQLIAEVRMIYPGPLTYAANWYEEYESITFWADLDYIGVQAYFPLSEHESPDVSSLVDAWGRYLPELSELSHKYGRKILFTEIGYKSTRGAAIRPWEWTDVDSDLDTSSCMVTQANCYHAFFDAVWNQPWFAGAHIWQYRADYQGSDSYFDRDFTPQGKSASEVIKTVYGERINSLNTKD